MVDLSLLTTGPYIAKAIYWGGVVLISGVILTIFYLVYHWWTFNIIMTYWELYGSGKDGIFSIGNRKTNRLKKVKEGTAWKTFKPWFNRKEHEPFDSEFIYPGNQVYAFKFGDVYIPARINITQSEDEIRGELNPVPYAYRNWQSLQHKINEQEFSKHNFWEDNKQFIMGMITVGICCAACLGTIWLTYKFAGSDGGGLAVIKAHTNALVNYGTIPGK